MDFTIKHLKGSENVLADFLSRQHYKQGETPGVTEEQKEIWHETVEIIGEEHIEQRRDERNLTKSQIRNRQRRKRRKEYTKRQRIQGLLISSTNVTAVATDLQDKDQEKKDYIKFVQQFFNGKEVERRAEMQQTEAQEIGQLEMQQEETYCKTHISTEEIPIGHNIGLATNAVLTDEEYIAANKREREFVCYTLQYESDKELGNMEYISVEDAAKMAISDVARQVEITYESLSEAQPVLLSGLNPRAKTFVSSEEIKLPNEQKESKLYGTQQRPGTPIILGEAKCLLEETIEKPSSQKECWQNITRGGVFSITEGTQTEDMTAEEMEQRQQAAQRAMEAFPKEMINLDHMGILQQQCPEISHIYNYVTKGTVPDNRKMARTMEIEGSAYIILDGVLYYKDKHYNEGLGKQLDNERLLIELPRCLRVKVVTAYHERIGHSGINLCATTIAAKFHWKSMREDIKQVIKFCFTCQTCKISRKLKQDLKPLGKHQGFGSRLIVDVWGGVDKSANGNQKVAVIIDDHTGFVWLKPMKSERAEDVLDALMEVFSDSGFPTEILSDNAGGFTAHLIKTICEAIGCVKTEAAPRSPHVMGKVERVNLTFGQMFRCRLAGKDTSHWERDLTMCQTACRAYSTPEKIISSYELVYGTEYRWDIDVNLISFHRNTPRLDELDEYVIDLKDRLKHLSSYTIAKGKEIDKQSKERFDREQAQHREFNVNDIVLLHRGFIPVGTRRKVTSLYLTDPFYITQVIDRHNVQLVNAKTLVPLKYRTHCNRIKKLYITEERKAELGIKAPPGEINVTNNEEIGVNEPAEMSAEAEERQEVSNNDNSETNDEKTDERENEDEFEEKEEEDKEYYAAECITKQRGAGKNLQYLVKFKPGLNGEVYPKHWCKAEHVTEELVNKYYETHTKGGKRRKRRVQ